MMMAAKKSDSRYFFGVGQDDKNFCRKKLLLKFQQLTQDMLLSASSRFHRLYCAQNLPMIPVILLVPLFFTMK
jgi:hypothetical protein